jgi:pyroglutamyl-peptidase
VAKKSPEKIILLTGFEPFAKHKVNSSWIAVSPLDGKIIRGRRVKTLRLPVEFRKPLRMVQKAIRKFNPQLVISFGLRDRPQIAVERAALNLNKEISTKGKKKIIRWHRTRRDGPVGYYPTIPVEKIERALRRANLPVEFSAHAGAYICNHIFYGTLDHVRRKRLKIPCGFIHVPPLKTKTAKHGLSARQLQRCAEVAVRAALKP